MTTSPPMSAEMIDRGLSSLADACRLVQHGLTARYDDQERAFVVDRHGRAWWTVTPEYIAGVLSRDLMDGINLLIGQMQRQLENDKLDAPLAPAEPLEDQVERLGQFLMEHYPREIGRGYPGQRGGDEGAIDIAIRLLTPGGSNPAGRRPEGPADWSETLKYPLIVTNVINSSRDVEELAALVGQRIADDLRGATDS